MMEKVARRCSFPKVHNISHFACGFMRAWVGKYILRLLSQEHLDVLLLEKRRCNDKGGKSSASIYPSSEQSLAVHN